MYFKVRCVVSSMYIYAFLLNLARPLDLPEGIWGSLELVCLDQLAALVEPDLTADSLQHDRQLMQAVLSHDRVIQEVFQQTTVMPLRFGTYFVSRQGLMDHLQSHQVKYLEQLTYLEGKAEYVLKIVPAPFPEPSAVPETTGKAYFLAKKQLYQAQANWQQQQQVELQALISRVSEYCPHRVRGEAIEGIERIYLLSSQPEAQALADSLQKRQLQFCDWELSLEQPLPPYHFV